MRVTRLPALTGTSTSKLARSLRQRRVLEGTRTAPPASGHHPNDDAPAATPTSHAIGCENGAARVGLSPGANDIAPATARVEDLKQHHAALALATTPPSSRLRLVRVTRLPALTGKSTSKL
jgi:hypothetical protein